MHPSLISRIWLSASLVLLVAACQLSASSRIKDLTKVGGVRDNQLSGYGIVVGLAGEGDGALDFTTQAVSNMLKEYGVNVDPNDIQSSNVAAVMVTAEIKPFMREGSRLDITISSLGDAATLQGGVLLQTPLYGADGEVYAVAQGAVAVGGFIGGASGPGGATVQQNHPTVGTIPGGAIVEREIKMALERNGSLDLLINNPDFTTAVRMADVINVVYPGAAQAVDSSTVNVRIPAMFNGQTPNFIAAIEALEVEPDGAARVIINEKTGTIVATRNVRVSTVAISHGSLTITIASNLTASQPNPLGGGDTVVLPGTEVSVTEKRGGFRVVDAEQLPTIDRLSAALNALGVSTREMMSILQSLKTAGALQAELILN